VIEQIQCKKAIDSNIGCPKENRLTAHLPSLTGIKISFLKIGLSSKVLPDKNINGLIRLEFGLVKID